jgi:hypothetical protein
MKGGQVPSGLRLPHNGFQWHKPVWLFNEEPTEKERQNTASCCPLPALAAQMTETLMKMKGGQVLSGLCLPHNGFQCHQPIWLFFNEERAEKIRQNLASSCHKPGCILARQPVCRCTSNPRMRSSRGSPPVEVGLDPARWRALWQSIKGYRVQ